MRDTSTTAVSNRGTTVRLHAACHLSLFFTTDGRTPIGPLQTIDTQDASKTLKLTDFGLSRMLIVKARRVESVQNLSAMAVATSQSSLHQADDVSVYCGGSVAAAAAAAALAASAATGSDPPVPPLQDKMFKMSGETGSYKYMARHFARLSRCALLC